MERSPERSHIESQIKTRAAALSIVSNSALILLKFVAGLVTGSIAILTEVMHSGIDLVASVVTFVSVRKAAEPADERHLYGHEKIENLAAAIEGVLILIGSAVIAIEAIRRLVSDRPIDAIGFGIAVVALSIVVNAVVSTYLYRCAKLTDSAALESDAAHLRADAFSSLAVIAGLVLVEVTGESSFDAIVALVVAAGIVAAGIRILLRSSRVLIDEALPEDELALVGVTVGSYRQQGVAGFHKLRARRAGARRHIDMHVQFVAGTTLEEAHSLAHRLKADIETELRGADVLIHIEPEAR